MRKILRILVGFLVSSSAFALVAGPATVTGTIKSFDEKTVVVQNEDNKYEIPKDFVAEKNLKAGQKIEVLLSQDQLQKVKMGKARK